MALEKLRFAENEHRRRYIYNRISADRWARSARGPASNRKWRSAKLEVLVHPACRLLMRDKIQGPETLGSMPWLGGGGEGRGQWVTSYAWPLLLDSVGGEGEVSTGRCC